MTGSRLTIAGRVLRHAMGVLLLCWLRALKWGAIAGLAGVAAAEIGAVVLTHSFPPDGLSQIVAFLLGAALAFGVAVTIIADELVVGIIDTIRVLVGEAEAGARAAAMVARRDVGESSRRVLALFGLGGVAAAGAARLAAPTDMLAAPPRVAQGPRDEVGPRLQALRARVPSSSIVLPPQAQPLATENPWAASLTPVSEWPSGKVAAVTVPTPTPESVTPAAPVSATTGASEQETVTPRVDAETLLEVAGAAGALGEPNSATRPLAKPVHATNLPRIDWAAEAPPAVEPEPPAGDRVDRSDAFGAPSPTTRPMPDAPGLAEPSIWHIHETMPVMPERWHDPTQSVEPEPEEAGITPVDLFGAPPPAAPLAQDITRDPDTETRPLPERTRPLDSGDLAGQPRGSVWDHISQVLAGRPVPPIPSADDPALDDPAENDPSAPGAGY